MTIPEVIALTAALSAFATAYFQARSVRIAEAQMKTQLHSLGEVVQRLEQERLDRQRAISDERTARANAVTSAISAEHDKGWKDHSNAWNFTTSTHAVQCAQLSRLSQAVCMLARHHLIQGGDPDTERLRLLVVSSLAAAVAGMADLEFDYGAYVLTTRTKGEEVKSVDDVFGGRSQATRQEMTNAWEAFSAFLTAENKAIKEGGA